MSRHMTNAQTSKYWKLSYTQIRKYYPETLIIIIDDKSPYNDTISFPVTNCKILSSEYPQRGELLAFYYFYKYKYAKYALIIHDSVFLQCKITWNFTDPYVFLWNFAHNWDKPTAVLSQTCLSKLKMAEPLSIYNNQEFTGCFGAMMIISLEMLEKMEERFNFLEIFLCEIRTRAARMSFERMISCLCVAVHPTPPSLFGTIHNWVWKTTEKKKSWNIYYQDYESHRFPLMSQSPVVKIWSGR